MAKRAILVEVNLQEGETSERLIKRFMRECKKCKIEEQARENMAYYTKSQKKRRKREKSYARKVSEERKKMKKEMKQKKMKQFFS